MKVPCKQCPVFISCKVRYRDHIEMYWSNEKLGGSISELAMNEDCKRLEEFFDMANQDQVNEARVLFGMEPYK